MRVIVMKVKNIMYRKKSRIKWDNDLRNVLNDGQHSDVITLKKYLDEIKYEMKQIAKYKKRKKIE